MIYALKVLISAVVIATASEIAKRIGPFWAAVLIAMPLTSILAMSLTYWDTRNSLLMAEFARSILIPSHSWDAGTGTGGATTPAAPVPNATATASSCPGDACANSITTGRASAKL